ncbi:MAG: MFS transporter, partial [Deltaproteobacteria bacterium]
MDCPRWPVCAPAGTATQIYLEPGHTGRLNEGGAMVRSSLSILFTTIALDLIGFGMVVPLLPLYAKQYGASASAIAWLLATYSLMQFVFAPLWGRLSDRIGRRPVLLASIAGNVGALCLFASAPSYLWLLLARTVAGVCTANIAVANAYVADITGPHDRARGMGIVGAAFGLGFVLGPFFGGELSTIWGVAAPAWA